MVWRVTPCSRAVRSYSLLIGGIGAARASGVSTHAFLSAAAKTQVRMRSGASVILFGQFCSRKATKRPVAPQSSPVQHQHTKKTRGRP